DLDGEEAGDNSGWSVSMSNDGLIVAIGAYGNDGAGTDAGHVRVYKLISGVWTQQGADIEGETAYNYSGCSVSMSADGLTVAIGAYRNDGTSSAAGHVRVYELITGVWTQQGADIDGEAEYDQSGTSISMSADGLTVAIGAYLNDGTGSAAGHVRVYSFCVSDSSTDTQTACDSITWLNGITYTSNNNSATHTLPNAIGCDSVVTLNLTIASNTKIETITACDSISWIDGNTYSASNNIATHTVNNAAGCDSVITLNLTIDTVDVSVTNTDPTLTASITGVLYQWLDCGNSYEVLIGEVSQNFTAIKNGDYAVEVTGNSCTDTSVCIAITNVGLERNPLFKNVFVFPNPNDGMVNIDLGNLKEISIKVYNVYGQLVYHRENINATIHQFELNEVSGIYLLEVSSQGEEQQYKLEKK
ncbi:MAG: T9SS type A sorting domain-containing protein, partial [Bacteroidia bacterium]|nr:T9SS type A sorting domain-containing protein [Bacteroidia bacterium]